ncbi:FAD-dependent thymidylate synthase [Mesorhizobium sp. M8A.F.Ca.ET.021.01.1.1]|uniref:FAD-dependent thymidylate synthase n=1 Tax=Mesorhizobium sp. M8A.F.Ca.ET.021.01.1.1 TaxID=2496757 RepID=UPI000FC9B3A9|nr:FAD-dependent thymidylate synthase [Mesorhizobium sp. M8A.F.Ca.ET.021.01.1.1]RUW57128.1 hypothetical protein EOA36_00665 [Mesorhizobium sp. M8A.F.Ca.ET.021.01.1.1]
MEISADILADSISESGIRITTLELHYHRYILPEFNTHRAFSRNGASSRAIPTEKLIAACLRELVEPLEWGLNQSGMQAFNIADDALTDKGRAIWNAARADAVRHALELNGLGFAKQIVNRVLEPYLSTRTVVTSTDWANFDGLRDHKDAQPEIRDLAQKVKEARLHSTPNLLRLGEWHKPYIEGGDEQRLRSTDLSFAIPSLKVIGGPNRQGAWFNSTLDAVKVIVSAARSARVSYRTVEGKPTDYVDDCNLFQRLIVNQPVHASPTEHQATPFPMGGKLDSGITRNFRGWVPFRALIAGDTIED